MFEKPPLLVSIAGPTAVGKTHMAIEIAQYFNTEIISVDSRQFYQELEIGTAKPEAGELRLIKHHFINSHSIQEYYNVGHYQQDVTKLLDVLFTKHRVVVAVGGSGLFFKAIWHGMDEMPEVDLAIREQLNQEFLKSGLAPLLEELKFKDESYYHQVDQNNHQRVIRALEVIRSSGKPFSGFHTGTSFKKNYLDVKIGLELERAVLFDRINQRMDQMIKAGLFEEAEALMSYQAHNALQTVGYSEIFGYLSGKYDREEAIRLLKRNSRRYAKRQMTWFKKEEGMTWMQPNDLSTAIRLIEAHLNA